MKYIFFLAASLTLTAISVNSRAQASGNRTLDPAIAGFLQLIGNRDLTLDQLRSLPMDELKYPKIPLIPYPKEDVQRLKITSDSIPVLVWNPLHKKGLPVIIHYHGGGFISPLVPGLEQSLWQDAKTYEAVVFAVDYSVAPEHRYPAAVNDSYQAFKWISENAGKLGGDTSKLILMGNSAGANLVAVISQKAKKENISSRIKLQVMNGLPADMRPQHMEASLSYQQNATGYFQTKALCYFAVETYAPGQTDNPEVSPILTKDLTGLPPAVIVTAEFDPLKDDGILYASRLREAGVPVWEKCFAGQIHCLLGALPNSRTMNAYQRLVISAIKEVFLKKDMFQ